jgi:mRNA-degrading endonuclease RelE of RelBE toxin-antitoxin system
MYMTTVPVAEARQNFSALVDEAVTTHQRIQVTRNGVPANGSSARPTVSYRVILRPAALRTLQTMPEIATACCEFIHGPLAENPYRAGKPLLEPLAPQYSARRGEYRVLDLNDDDRVIVNITSVTHRADAYRRR